MKMEERNSVNRDASISSFPRDIEQSSKSSISPVEKFEEEDNDFSSSSQEPLRFQDDASLCLPSSLIRFRTNDSTARVYPDERGQFIIEETFVNNSNDKGKNNEKAKIFNAKWIETSNVSVKFLRASYTLVAVFFTGFILVLALELLLYVILDLTIEAGITNKGDFHPFSALGVFLAFPLYIYGLSEALVISWFFVTDAWNGHLLVKLFGFGKKAVLIAEWCTFFLYFGIPILTLIGTLLGGVENWWTVTSLTWFVCMSIAFCIFGLIILWYEFRANWEVTRNRFDDDDDRWHCLINRAILLRQRHLFGGIERSTYLVRGDMDNFKDNFKGGSGNHEGTRAVEMISKGKTLYCRIISWKIWEKLGIVEHLKEPEVQYSVKDAQNIRAYMTAHTWSLETVFCRSRHSRYIVVLGGKQALTNSQIQSSVVCAILGNTIGFLLLLALLRFLNVRPRGLSATIIVLVCVFILYPSMARSYRIAKMTKSIKKLALLDKKLRALSGKGYTVDDDSFVLEHNESEGMFQVWESNRVVTLTSKFCWVLFSLEVILLFLYPLVAIIGIGCKLMAFIFVIVSVTSFIRSYFNAAIVVEETGKMDLVDGEKGSRYHWQNMSRLNIIIRNVTRSPASKIWIVLLLALLLIFVNMGLMTVTSEATNGRNHFLTYLPEFEYKQQNDVPYPTCSSAGNFDTGGLTNRENHQLRKMADYSFLAALAYVNDNITQRELDLWFNLGGIRAEFDPTAVSTFRQSDSTTGAPVVYKLIKFPSEKEAIVTIRGSTDPVDFLVDGQLWMGAALFQILRYIMPAGNIWTPIIHYLIQAINLLESESIRKISFYKETTKFLIWLQRSGMFNNIQVTGHSLGGGLAMISGAQTGVAGIGVSAPNTKLSRTSFNLTIDDLNTKTFNIIPERDVVAMIDDVAQNYQRIRCTANSGDFIKDTVECHGSGERTLCEFLYTCGTQSRPALCECVYNFGYPEPKPKEGFENLNFDEECCLADNRWCNRKK